MRFNSWIAAILFGIALIAAAIVFARWTFNLSRVATNLERVGNPVRADLFRELARRMLIWGVSTVLFTAVFWFAVCHDLNHQGSVQIRPDAPLLP